MLITAGNTENEMFILHDGLLRSFYKGKYGKEFYKVFLSNFQVASAFIELEAGIPSEIYIEALERTEVFCIKHKDVKELYRRHMCWNLIGNKGIEYFPRLKETR